MAARREEDLGGGRASWLVPFGVINHYTEQPRLEKEGEETGRKKERNPPLKSPPGKKREEEEKEEVEKKEERKRRKSRRKKQ